MSQSTPPRASRGAGLALALILAGCESQEHGRSEPGDSARGASAPAAGAAKEAGSTGAAPGPRPAKAGMVTSSMAFPTGDPRTSSLQVDKLLPAQVMVGQDFGMTMRVTNLTGRSIENVVLTETSGGELDLKDSSVQAETIEGKRVWRLGDLGPNAFTEVHLTAAAKKPERIDTCLSVSYDTALCASISVVAPALTLVASGTSTALECDDIVYAYVVTNTGTGTADNVNVRVDLPEGLADETGRRSLTRHVGALDSGQSVEIIVGVEASKTGEFEHVATAVGANNLSAESEPVVTTVTRPALAITATGTEKAFVGRIPSYDVTVENTGDGLARNAILEHEIPAGLTFVSATQGGRQVGNRVAWNLGDVAPGDAVTVNLKLKSAGLGTFLNRATARAYCTEAVSASASTSIVGIPAILMEVIDVEDPIEVGQIETYVITITNQGTAPYTSLKVVVTMPPNTEFVSAEGTTPAMAGAGTDHVVALTPLATLAPKAKATWQVRLRGTSAADARFKVEVTSDQLTSPVNETEATSYYE